MESFKDKAELCQLHKPTGRTPLPRARARATSDEVAQHAGIVVHDEAKSSRRCNLTQALSRPATVSTAATVPRKP